MGADHEGGASRLLHDLAQLAGEDKVLLALHPVTSMATISPPTSVTTRPVAEPDLGHWHVPHGLIEIPSCWDGLQRDGRVNCGLWPVLLKIFLSKPSSSCGNLPW